MSCKYKKFERSDGIHPWCWVTGEECQFLKEPYDSRCPILAAYPNVPMDKKEYNKIEISNEVKTKLLNIKIDED